ncbi:conserved hypothetical protein [Trichormus variabilis ATCC 29413]|uniref:Uncharacterized protein n=1 Tax=Trichormus variabilis (strain ATCC 29413 / PCC 7937) TaxID=240292 RepID=Q3M3N8_TRIV2|nr:conserved hypothetical protein [Trichormus variabilis ATCC 29413]
MGKLPHAKTGAFTLPGYQSIEEDRDIRLDLIPNTMMEYLYYLANASLTLRVVQYLHGRPQLPVSFVTVIHQIDGWVVRIKLKNPVSSQEDGDFRAFLNELGISYEPPMRVQMALWSLEAGQCPVDVMRRYQVAIVSHGSPEREEIEAFRQQFVRGLGYCPETLA